MPLAGILIEHPAFCMCSTHDQCGRLATGSVQNILKAEKLIYVTRISETKPRDYTIERE